MKTKTETILTVMNVLAWITCIGLWIKAGAILVSFAVTLLNPEGAKDLYEGLDLSSVRQISLWQYAGVISFKIAITLMEAHIAFLVIKVLSTIKMSNPFTIQVSNLLEKISYVMFSTWIIAMISDAQVKWLSKSIGGLEQNLISGEFIFLAGVVFVISQVFKKGVQIQLENELTV